MFGMGKRLDVIYHDASLMVLIPTALYEISIINYFRRIGNLILYFKETIDLFSYNQ